MTNSPSHRVVIQKSLSRFEEALTRKDMSELSALFEDECYWRDYVVFTWDMIVFEGVNEIEDMPSARLVDTVPTQFFANRTKEVNGVVQGSFVFYTCVRSVA